MNQETTIVESNFTGGVKRHIPDKYALAVIIVAVVIFPLQVVYNISYAPSGYEYAYGTDELVQAATANSYIWNYQNPYGASDDSIFKNPVLGSVYLQAFFGLLSAISGVSPLFFIQIFSVLFSFLFYVLLYKLFAVYVDTKNKKLLSLLMFVIVSGGLGGILYIMLNGILPSTASIHLLNSAGLLGSMLVYQLMSAFFGLFALYTVLRYNEKHCPEWEKTALLLGISALIYPLYSLVFLGMIVIASLVKKDTKMILSAVAAEIIFLIPWIPTLMPGGTYSQYLRKADYINIFVYAELGIFLLLLSTYYLYRYVKDGKWDFNRAFLLLWAVLFVALTIMPPMPPIQPQRLLQISWMPLSIAASLGFLELIKRKRAALGTAKYIIFIMLLVTLPTTLIWYNNGFSQDIEKSYLTADEINVLEYLRPLEEGNVLSSPEIGLRVPVFAAKRSLMSGVDAFDSSAKADYEKFMSIDTFPEDSNVITDKYNIKYIVADVGLAIDGFSEIYRSGDIAILRRD